MYQKLFQDFASLILSLALSFSAFSPTSTNTQQKSIQAEEECTSQTGQVYPCDGSTVSISSVDASAESIPNPGDQVHRVAVFHDGADFAGQALVSVLNTNPEIAASVVTREFVEAGGLAEFSCVVARLPGFGDTPTAPTVQAIQDFIAGGGGYIGEWWGAGAALSGAGPSVDGDYGIPARFLSLFSGLVSDGGAVQFDNPITVTQDHPVVEGLPGTFSGGGGTEFFVRPAPPLDPGLTVLATYEGHGGTNPAIMVGQSGASNAVLLSFDAMDEPGNANLSQLWLNSVKFACPLQEFQPPTNDNFANAEAITAPPFTATVDLTDATNEPDEPHACSFMQSTVWYSFTPSENVAVRADALGSAITGNVNVYLSSGPGFSDLSFLGCSIHANAQSFNFLAEAGQTYYLQAGSGFGQVGSIQINLEQSFPPVNDNFANEEVITSLPFTATVDIIDATNQLDEPHFCTFMESTVWYSFTPSENVAVRADAFGGAITGNVNVYLSSGPGFSDLSFLGCSIGSGAFNFLAEVGQTYYLQAGSAFGQVGSIQINLQESIPPANDNFANTESIDVLPFTSSVDITDATNEPDEPQFCTSMERTVWYSFTPSENVAVRADAFGGAITGNVNVYLSSGPGFGDISFIGCSIHANAQSFNFNVEAGQTYYLQAGSAFGQVGSIQINLQESIPPANDNFADTESIDGVPFTSTVDITDATNEPDEPQLCTSMERTVWYSFTPTENMAVRADASGGAIPGNVNVYLSSGPGFGDLTFIGCSINVNSNSVGFHAEAGETYYLQAGSAFGEIGSIQINLEQIFPPAIDNFADAEAIDALPFTSTVDITDATLEADEPQLCHFLAGTVWYAFTPAETMFLRANTQGSAINAKVNIYRAFGPGFSDLQALTCSNPSDSAAFVAEAGQTYYLQAGGIFGETGNIQVNLEQIPPPPNDDFDNAITVDALPFTNTQDTSGGTSGADDPMDCSNNGSVWYEFTPENNTTLVAVANTFGSNYDTVLAVYTGNRGALQQVPGGCNDDTNSLQSRVAFDAVGGTTYYFMIGFCCGNGDAGGGNLVFSIEEAPASSNDNFANAAPIDSLPSTIDFDTTAATLEAGEPAPSCAQPPNYTLWYAFTPSETGSVSAIVFSQSFNSFFAIYSGSSLNDLEELGCRGGGLLTFTATQGERYYIQVGSVSEGSRGSGTLSLEATTAPQASFFFNPHDPSVFDTIQFCDNSFDPGEVGFESFAWDFGNGVTVATADGCLLHRYTVAGDYTVVLTVTTLDGRTASTSQIVSVRTHDVTITKVDAPDAGRVGQTKNITVHVGNAGNPDPETVTIDLYRSVPGGGFEYVTSLTQTVPTTRRGRPTRFTFQYTFTAQDAELGKVVFRAVANIDGLRDAFEQDNEMRSPVTTIRRPASYPNYP